jgi:hypothetical protein
MPLPQKLSALLASLTPAQISAMNPVARQQLDNEAARVRALIKAEDIVADVKRATAPRSGVLADLRNGKGRE